MSLLPGVCSVTFRERPVDEVVRLTAAAGLECIEWGGDVHVPHGSLATAARAAELTVGSGLVVASYGSYLFADRSAAGETDVVLDTAEAMGTSLVRIWAPFGLDSDSVARHTGRPADGTDSDDSAGGANGSGSGPGYGEVVDALAGICDAAADRDMSVYLEFHGGTPTATASSSVALLDAVDAENLMCAWQPPYWALQSLESDLADLAMLAPRLAHLHVYSWLGDGTRRPLAMEGEAWTARFDTASAAPPVGDARRAALLEFVADDDPAVFAADARQLLECLG